MKYCQRINKDNGEVECLEKLHKYIDRTLDNFPDGSYLLWFAETDRTDAQNKYYWVVVGIIANTIGWMKNKLHDYFKEIFLPEQEYFVVIKKKRTISTTTLDKDEMADYINRVIAFAAENGIDIPDLEEYKHSK